LGQSVAEPNFTAAFSIGARYNASASNDFELNWTHLTNTTNGSFFASPTQMVGPPHSIGPETNDYKNAFGAVHTGMMQSISPQGIPSATRASSSFALLAASE
jgi:Legionella pneumophila major outer membrane protein precursor